MPAIELFEIFLDRTSRTFSPGELVSGRVVVQLSEPKNIRDFKLRFKGKAKVQWEESTGSGRNKKTRHYSAEEEYFRMDVIMIPHTGSDHVVVPAGRSVYPFSLMLPLNIPSTFEHPHGHVRYTLKAIMDRPWKFDHEKEISIDVNVPLMLGQLSTELAAVYSEEEVNFCCFPFCLNRGGMHLQITFPTSGYSCGDRLQAKINVNNTSGSIDVTRVKLRLVQKIVLHSTSKKKTCTENIQKVEDSGPYPKKAEIALAMDVPTVPHSRLSNCGIIDIEYYARVTVCVSGCHCATSKEFPILIGSRPAVHPQIVQDTPYNPEYMPVSPYYPMPAPCAPNLEDPTTGWPGTSQAPAPGFANPVPNYGSVVNSPPYPIGMPMPMGFDLNQANRPVDSPDRPPPSYDQVVGTDYKR